MFNKEDIERCYPAWKTHLNIPIEKTVLPQILQKFWERKAAMRQLFPFDKEGNIFLIGGPENLSQTFKCSLSLLRSLLQISHPLLVENQDDCIFSGRLPDGTKLGKALLAHVNNPTLQKEYKNYIDEQANKHTNRLRLGDTNQTLFSELPRLPFTKKPTLDVFLQNFYSEVAGKKAGEVELMLSVNPYHMLNASHSEKFSSCNKLGGAYQNAPFCAANSPTMAILRLTQRGSLVGRAWVGFSVDYKAVIVKTRYGNLNEGHIKTFLTWYCDFLKRKFGITQTVKTPLHNSVDEVPALSNQPSALEFYQDRGGTLLVPVELDSYPVIEPGEGFCTLCGKMNKRIFCDNCQQKLVYCHLCGAQFYPEEESIILCPTCSRDHKSCPTCGYLTRKNAPSFLCSCEKKYCAVCGTTGVMEIFGGGILHIHKTCLTPTCTCCKNKKPISSFIVEGEPLVSVCSDCRKNAPKTVALQYIHKMKQLRNHIQMPAKVKYALAA